MDGAGVDVVDDPGGRAEALDIGDAIHDQGQLAHGAEDAAGADGVAAAHAHAVFLADCAVDAAVAHGVSGEAEHDKISAGQGSAPIGGGFQAQVDAGFRDRQLRQPSHLLQALRILVDEGQRATVEMRRVDHLPDGLPAEE